MSLHRVADKIGEKKEAIEKSLFSLQDFSQDNGQRVTLFYDLTNVYFEGRAEAISIAKRGHSKEKRSDCSLVSLALCCNLDGSVIKSQILPGNVSKTKDSF